MENNIYYFTKPNIAPESFEIILNYIYGGTVSLEKFDGGKILELLVATDELCLNELLEYVQDYFIIKENDWLHENFNEYCHLIFQHDNFQKLQEHCIKMVSDDPQKFRRHGRFMQWPDNLVIGILKRDDLHLEEIDVWNILIKWGTAQIKLPFNNPNDWTSDDFSKLALKLKDCDGKDPNHSILSRIKYSNFKCAIDDSPCIGPCFGTSDLAMVESSRVANGKFIYDLPWSCIQNCYERTITSTTNFAIEDYEVFKLIQKTPRTT
ncbi:unnamed protein product [Rhizophagus irregularis]|nr:unnamed protein product [Rhizophagus irregularis]